jgi:HNH endonuclease.
MLMTRVEAVNQGYKHYFTGIPCRNGHISKRLVLDGDCLECYRKRHIKHQKAFRNNNPDHVRSIVRKSNNKAYKLDSGKYKAKVAKRKALKLRATPIWANLKDIENFYRKCPIGYQVDHIIPLQGDNVCGFHVLNNLQYLTASENASKKNNWNPEASVN